MSEYMDNVNRKAESALHQKGGPWIVVHKDALDRDEKELARVSSRIVKMGDHFGLQIDEEPATEDAFPAHVPDPDHVCDDNDDCEFHEYQGPVESVVEQPVMPPNTPTIPDELEGLTVAQLKEIAETEEIDISDVKLKADIVGRIWGAREMRAEDEKENG